MTKFSIITPSFNQAKFIGKTIESVITQQGDFEIEYVVIDGGSTDGTVEILKDYESRIENKEFKGNRGIDFYWQSKKDKGQSDAINQGLKKATGDIIAYINSDDYYEKDCFSKVSDGFRMNQQTPWLTGYCRIVNEEDQPIQSLIAKYKNMWLNRYSYQNLLCLNFICQPATFWYRRGDAKIELFDQSLLYTMDYDYWLRLGRISKPIIIKEYLANFRIHSTSKGGTNFVKQFNEDYQTAAKRTKSPVLLWLHRLHNSLITLTYRVIK